MNIVIVGCGRVGHTLAEKLNGDGNEVTVMDMSAAKVQELADKFDVMGVVGNGGFLLHNHDAYLYSLGNFVLDRQTEK